MTMTPTTMTFLGAKGGVGTTTVAVLHALELAERGITVHLSARHHGGVDDLAAIVGASTPDATTLVELAPNLTLSHNPHPAAHNVVDGGVAGHSDQTGPAYLVVRNDYLSLRRALAVAQTTLGIIVLTEPRRPLTVADITRVLAAPVVAELAVDAETARRIDAGVFATSRRRRLNIPPAV